MSSRLIAFLLLLVLAHSAWAKEAAPAAEDPVLEQRVMALAAELRCLVCQNESLAESKADLAVDLRNQVREKMKQGKSDAEVVDFLVARYGDFVLYRPPFKLATALLWFGPLILLLAGLGALYYRLARRRAAVGVELSEAERKRAAELLAAGDAAERK